MQLKEFLESNNWSAHFFSKMVKLHPQTILNILDGKKVRAKTAKRIEKITSGKVKIDFIYSKKLLHQ